MSADAPTKPRRPALGARVMRGLEGLADLSEQLLFPEADQRRREAMRAAVKWIRKSAGVRRDKGGKWISPKTKKER